MDRKHFFFPRSMREAGLPEGKIYSESERRPVRGLVWAAAILLVALTVIRVTGLVG